MNTISNNVKLYDNVSVKNLDIADVKDSDINSGMNCIENSCQLKSEPIVVDEDNNYDTETALVLGGELIINNQKFPPPTTAFIMFLDLIQSPFITGNKPMETDLYEALFVLKYRENAISDIFGIFSAKKYLDKYEPLVEKSPEYLDIVLKYRERFESQIAKFRTLAASFGEQLGVINLEETTLKISEYIEACFGGFEMVPDKGKRAHKKKELMQNG